jgi:signal transduction histidine kinase
MQRLVVERLRAIDHQVGRARVGPVNWKRIAREGARLTTWTARWVAWVVGLTSIALMIAALVFRFVDRNLTLPLVSDAWSISGVLDVAVNIAAPVIGTVIVSRRSGNLIGWLFLAAGLLLGAEAFARAYGLHALLADPGAFPGGRASVWLSNWVDSIAVCLLPFLFLLFPTGHLPSRRWRPLTWLSWGILVLLPLNAMVLATVNWSRPFADLFASTEGSLAAVAEVTFIAAALALIVAVVGSFGSVLVRFRRSVGEERLQLKWFVTAAALVAVTFCVALITNSPLADLLFNVSLVCLDASIAVAILKYRLYDIDLIIGKAVLYGVLGAFITVVYVLVVVVIGAFIGATEGLALVATAIVGVAFQPVRERAKRTANRLVYGKRATPYEVLSGFSSHVGEAFAGEEIIPRMARLLAEGTGASRATVWLRVGSELRPTASWPANGGTTPLSSRPVGDELPTFDDVGLAVPVRRQGELLGALTIEKPLSEPTISPAEERLVAELAAQAGLVLENFRLIEDLRSSRQRLVAAQDEERRRLERDLHDGAQQQLVALAVKVRLAENLVGSDEQRERETLHAILAHTHDALENLRELARGVYPPLLSDHGMVAALEAQARRSPIPTTVEADGIGRYAPDLEIAVYFCVLEAMQNIAKYAEASRATILLREREGTLDFNVMDDGRGFDKETTPLGMGLQSMADRMAAIGGSLDVKTGPGRGTNVVGRIPLP